MIKPLMLCPSNMRVISFKHFLTLFLQYSLQMIMLVVVVVVMMMMMMMTTTTMMIFPQILVPF